MQNIHSINKLINKTDNSNMYSDEEIDASSSSSANLFTVGLCVKDDKANKQAVDQIKYFSIYKLTHQ